MAVVAVILGGGVGFVAALLLFLAGMPLLTAGFVWCLGGAGVAGLLLLAAHSAPRRAPDHLTTEHA